MVYEMMVFEGSFMSVSATQHLYDILNLAQHRFHPEALARSGLREASGAPLAD